MRTFTTWGYIGMGIVLMAILTATYLLDSGLGGIPIQNVVIAVVISIVFILWGLYNLKHPKQEVK